MQRLFLLCLFTASVGLADRLEDLLPPGFQGKQMMECTRTPVGFLDCTLVRVAPSVRIVRPDRSQKPCVAPGACQTVVLSSDPRAGAWVQGIQIGPSDYAVDQNRPLCSTDPGAVCTGYPPAMPDGYFCINLDKRAAPYTTNGAAALMYSAYVQGDPPKTADGHTATQWFFGFLGDPTAAMQLRAGVPSSFSSAGVVGSPGAFFQWFPIGPGCKGYPAFTINAAVMIPWTWPTSTVTDAYVFVVLP